MAQKLLHYEVLERLGEGARSTIYHVVDPASQKHFALKHVVRATGKDIRFVEQLQAEHVLQSTDLVAEGGGRDVQFFRRLGETQMTRGRLEGAQRVERWQGPAHALVSFISGARNRRLYANSYGIR